MAMTDSSDMFRCTIVDEHNSPEAVMVLDFRRDELIGILEGLTEFPIEWLVSLTIERIDM